MRAQLRQPMLALLAFSIAQGCGAARAADDKSTIGAAMELLGYSSDPSTASIDYRERAKLVIPPKAGDLPTPTEKTSSVEGWPQDPGGARRRNSDRYSKIPNAPPPEKKAGLLERLRGPAPEAAPGTDDEPGLLQRIVHKRQNQTLSMEEPARRVLTDPPSGYRQPTMDLNSVAARGGKKSSWLNPFGLMSKSDDNDPVARTDPSQDGHQSTNASGGILSSMVPSFMKESSN
jgi:hypothetical protein